MMDFDKVGRLMGKGVVEVALLAFMRGRTLNASFVDPLRGPERHASRPPEPRGGGGGGGNTATIFRFPRGGLMELALLDQPILRELML
jgi:hypothetical protein